MATYSKSARFVIVLVFPFSSIEYDACVSLSDRFFSNAKGESRAHFLMLIGSVSASQRTRHMKFDEQAAWKTYVELTSADYEILLLLDFYFGIIFFLACRVHRVKLIDSNTIGKYRHCTEIIKLNTCINSFMGKSHTNIQGKEKKVLCPEGIFRYINVNVPTEFFTTVLGFNAAIAPNRLSQKSSKLNINKTLQS